MTHAGFGQASRQETVQIAAVQLGIYFRGYMVGSTVKVAGTDRWVAEDHGIVLSRHGADQPSMAPSVYLLADASQGLGLPAGEEQERTPISAAVAMCNPFNLVRPHLRHSLPVSWQ